VEERCIRVPNGSVLGVNDGNELFAWVQNKNDSIYAPFPLTDIHGREDIVVNKRQESITRKEYRATVKTVNSLKYMVQTRNEYLMPSAERGGWPPEDPWVE